MLIKIKKHDIDDPPHIQLFFSHGDFAASQDSYISDEEFLEFGEALQTFPQSLKHEVVFESGSPDPTYYCYILLRAFIHDGVGHSALEVRVENHGNEPYAASAHFYIPCEAATLNRLGQSLELWIHSKETAFEFSADAA